VGHNRVVFNIRSNRYRLVMAINDAHRMVDSRLSGSHHTYDTIDAATV
jgi:mRNA-degrading endonuclease HigB of HigAB toxin-antitoxin module